MGRPGMQRPMTSWTEVQTLCRDRERVSGPEVTRRNAVIAGAALVGGDLALRSVINGSTNEEAPHWVYEDEGEAGEDNWGNIDPA